MKCRKYVPTIGYFYTVPYNTLNCTHIGMLKNKCWKIKIYLCGAESF